jgi:hypothetical protein
MSAPSGYSGTPLPLSLSPPMCRGTGTMSSRTFGTTQ